MSESVFKFQLPSVPASANVAILGGSFNPPHLAHALLAHAALQMLNVDAVWVVPCADHPFAKVLAPFDARLAMTKIAFRHLHAVSVIDVERHLPSPSYTVQTLRAVRQQRPDIALKLLVGADIIPELHLWREPAALNELAELVIFRRRGHAGGNLNLALPELSSTDARLRLARGESVDDVLDGAVIDYIRAHHLFTAVDVG